MHDMFGGQMSDTMGVGHGLPLTCCGMTDSTQLFSSYQYYPVQSLQYHGYGFSTAGSQTTAGLQYDIQTHYEPRVVMQDTTVDVPVEQNVVVPVTVNTLRPTTIIISCLTKASS